MSILYFPSCKIKNEMSIQSLKIQNYLRNKYDFINAGCCRQGIKTITPKDEAIVICNNCSVILEENFTGHIISVYEIIDNDPDFHFTDYGGEVITLQDCWLANGNTKLHETIRSLLKKMNFSVIELDEHGDFTNYHGKMLLQDCSESNRILAPYHYQKLFSLVAQKLTPLEQLDYLSEYCCQIKTERVVCYCKSCADGIVTGGKRAIHILKLLFPED